MCNIRHYITPRSRIDTMDHIYGVFEKFFNDMIFISKYNRHTLCITPPHVIVFSNDLPKTHTEKGNLTLSEERWNIFQVQRDTNNILMNISKKRSREPEPHSSTRCNPQIYLYIHIYTYTYSPELF